MAKRNTPASVRLDMSTRRQETAVHVTPEQIEGKTPEASFTTDDVHVQLQPDDFAPIYMAVREELLRRGLDPSPSRRDKYNKP